MSIYKSTASVTLDWTAPDEFTVAFLFDWLSNGVVTSSTAHRVASIRSLASSIARTILGAQRADARIRLAEIRFLKIDQIVFVRTGQTTIARSDLSQLTLITHFQRSIVFLFQVGAHLAKGRQLLITCSNTKSNREFIFLSPSRWWIYLHDPLTPWHLQTTRVNR